MVRKTIPSGKKKYVYYVCSAHKTDKAVCSAHTMRDSALSEITLELLKKHIQDVISLSSLLNLTSTALLQQANSQKLRNRLKKKQGENRPFTEDSVFAL